MKKLVLFLFCFSFISSISYANHHRDVNRDREGFNNDNFYDEYNSGIDRKSRNDHDGKKYKLKKGRDSKKRKHRQQKIRNHHQKMMDRVNKLPAAKKEEALREIKRHHEEMKRITGDRKPPHLQERKNHRDFDRNKAKKNPHNHPEVKLAPKMKKPKEGVGNEGKEIPKIDQKTQDSLSNKKLRYYRPRLV